MDRNRTGCGALLAYLVSGAALAGARPGPADDMALWARSRDDAAHLARSLEAMANRGEISRADLGRLKEHVFARWPGARTTPPPRVICQNHAVYAARAFARAQGVPVLAYPPPFTDYLESARLPIRVHHDGELEMAQIVLTAAEDAWYHQVEEVGYPAPFTDGDEGPIIPGLWLYVSDAGGAAGYAEPLAYVDFTEKCDCSARVVMDVANSLPDVPAIVAHEFNHATQMATDCREAISAFENFATAVMIRSHPDGGDAQFRIAEFQSYPDWPLDYWTNTWGSPSALYQYGAALFPLYLDTRFGNGDLTFLKDVWNAFAQSCAAANSPDWFEGLDGILIQRGSGLDETFDEFSSWRAIMGPHDDGQHLPDGALYPSATTRPLSLARLPSGLVRRVHEYGSLHVLLTDTVDAAPVDLTVSVEEGATFGASLLLWSVDGVVERRTGTFEGTTAMFSLDSLEGVSRAVVVVSHRSDGDYDPDRMDYSVTRSITVSATSPQPPDAGTTVPDARVGADARHEWETDGAPGLGLEPAPRGCVCHAAGRPASPDWTPLLGVLALLLRRRRPHGTS